MTGFYIGKAEESIEQVRQETTELRLLAKAEGVEIMEQCIQKDRHFFVYPGNADQLMEFFYILEGTVLNEETELELVKGDRFHCIGLEETVHFRALSDVRLLYVINEPVFHHVSQQIQHMSDIIRQVQEKDNYTKNHCNRVQEYAYEVAKRMGSDGLVLETLNYASLFHDLGKIHISNEILNKPGRLTDEEFVEIKKHPVYGKEIAEKSYYKGIGEIIGQHHERMDGSGYPDGLKGEEIRIEARIIAVVDTYDAMTSDRPYREGLSKQIAIDELKRCRGTQYDEKVVDTFLEILKEEDEAAS